VQTSEEKKQESAVEAGKHLGIVRQVVTWPWQTSCDSSQANDRINEAKGNNQPMATMEAVSIGHAVARHGKVTGE